MTAKLIVTAAANINASAGSTSTLGSEEWQTAAADDIPINPLNLPLLEEENEGE
jgi:hypothetical protein